VTFHGLAETITLAGQVTSVDENGPSFTFRCRSGDIVDVFVGETTTYEVLSNVDGVGRDRTQLEDGVDPNADPARLVVPNLRRYIRTDTVVYVRGIHQQADDRERFEARTVYLLQSSPGGRYVFEETHWWLDQTSRLVDRWLDDLFDASRDYTVSDFSKFYVTNLNIEGQKTDNDVQECATLSRLIYGLSSAYLLTGSERYFLAARAAVSYQREAFRSLTSDGTHCFWDFGRRRKKDGDKEVEIVVFASENDDDKDAIPLYEQIYALAGLAQYYRITADWEVLEDIRRTMNTFNDFYLDDGHSDEKPWSQGEKGYFSHLDPITMRPDTPALGANKLKKNWNSIGDHIPAYLVNLVLALDPLPHGDAMTRGLDRMADQAIGMLDDVLTLIVDKFFDEKSHYVNERFLANWTPDHDWKWQKDRAICGHNLKIAWNLTRCAFYLDTRARRLHDQNKTTEAQALRQRAESCRAKATGLADRMAEFGTDVLRGGVFDAVQRDPHNGMPIEFAWGSTKDFWQQEQGILAYLVLYGATGQQFYLDMARECMAFWNLFFLDRDRQGIFFRTTEGGLPWIEGTYAQKGGHSVSGYHVFELNYLAHLYQRTYLNADGDDRGFCLYFRVLSNREQTSINVLPDFMPPDRVEIQTVRVNGIDRTEQLKPTSVDDFQVRLEGIEPNPDDGSIDLVVEFAVH
jgi:mannose/cellobiose epimerase-like protein (N-acyl-D-glucosamine 2-epimerase family)